MDPLIWATVKWQFAASSIRRKDPKGRRKQNDDIVQVTSCAALDLTHKR